ncbi:hypothetical protein PSTG_08142 [Puccinia striiformis f. sp. tritici PST-78]|uniref:Uncharacterized protein n=1 Tax=Puccinia striiformis f. sp. tritici PST-78 TaxID=1165861 RepID=A0A0L0VH99_9BASI|nr:hypothetical protein PSTG_08142 [Puccinia striiformis f. sp. tritici PST-78]
MVELESAHAGNSGSELKTKDVRGILCSGNAWEFWEFCGNGDYTRSPQFPIPTEDVDVTVNQLRSIFEVTYRMFFEGYIEALESFIKRSQCKAQHDGKPRRPSLPQWVVSLELAKHAFITAKSAKDTPTFDEAVKQLHER